MCSELLFISFSSSSTARLISMENSRLLTGVKKSMLKRCMMNVAFESKIYLYQEIAVH